MKRIIISLTLCLFALSGCASTKSPSSLTQLQIKVNQLERKLEDREREIEELKFAVNNLTSQVDDSNSYSFNDRIEDIDIPSVKAPAKTSSAKTSGSTNDIIRVGENPQRIQTALKTAGYYNGAIDGKIGSGSQEAIRNFQRDHNLKADGIIGKNTWNELKNYLQ